MTTTNTVTTGPRLASGPGALEGFENRCTCGDTASYSLETMAHFEAFAHERWHLERAVARIAR